LVALLLTLATTALAAQTPVRLERELRFAKAPGTTPLGAFLSGAEIIVGRPSGGAVEIVLEGWLPSTSLGPMNRDGFDVTVTRRPTEQLRPATDGKPMARVSTNVGFQRLESDGKWTRVRRMVWVDQKALRVAAPASAPDPAASDRGALSVATPLAIVPGGAAVGSADSGTGLRVLSHANGWTRVQLEVWVPDSAVRPSDEVALRGVSQAEVRADPARYVGKVVEWRLQFVAIQKADELRPEIPQGASYLLTRGPLPELGFVYVMIPRSLLPRFEALPSLRDLTVRGTLRSASTKYLPTPVLELVQVVAGLGEEP
jgi:hypothetical protein